MKYPQKKKCTFCNDMAILMELKDLPKYYYHYSLNYDLGCHQRIGIINKERMKSLTKWTKNDEIKHLGELVKRLREGKNEIEKRDVRQSKFSAMVGE